MDACTGAWRPLRADAPPRSAFESEPLKSRSFMPHTKSRPMSHRPERSTREDGHAREYARHSLAPTSAGPIAASTVRDEEERKSLRYVTMLQEGSNEIPGIMSRVDMNGHPLQPYPHQRDAVKLLTSKSVQWFVLAHDAGTGKTATVFQAMAAMELLSGTGGVTTIVTAPPGTLRQWEDTAHTWLNIPNKHEAIVVTNKWKRITQEVLDQVRVLVTSRNTLAAIFKQSFHQVPTSGWKHGDGERWVRTPGTELHPLFRKPWTIGAFDEGTHSHAASSARTLTTRTVFAQYTTCATQAPNGAQHTCSSPKAHSRGESLWAASRSALGQRAHRS